MPPGWASSSMEVRWSLNSPSTPSAPRLRWSRQWGTWSTSPQEQWLDWPSSTPWKHPSLRKTERGRHTLTSHESLWLWQMGDLRTRWRRLLLRQGRQGSRSLPSALAGWIWARWRPWGASPTLSMSTWWPTLVRWRPSSRCSSPNCVEVTKPIFSFVPISCSPMHVCTFEPLVWVSVMVCVHMHVLGSEMCEVVDHQCQHICVSSPASYRCKCREGFTLNPDGKTCKGEETTISLIDCSQSRPFSQGPYWNEGAILKFNQG